MPEPRHPDPLLFSVVIIAAAGVLYLVLLAYSAIGG